MTPKQFKKLKESGVIDKEYELINGYLDEIGYSPYKQGPGNYGVRELKNKEGDIIGAVIINRMVDTEGEYPNYQFYDIANHCVIGIDYNYYNIAEQLIKRKLKQNQKFK